ncbi:protein cholesin [Sphaeramia orbicularis]|uniref:WKF domain-containing protein n=1 Tax=Sphaeramia orbicularis TaxID=375764 RepID=A0A673BUN0_9TELE|nr:uncharacterized protein C7orf50 homolog [Sphaeramia orbicularis]
MAKDKTLKSKTNGESRKRKKVHSFVSEVHVETVTDQKVKKKRKKPNFEEAPPQITGEQITPSDKKQKDGKRKKKQKQTEETKISDPPSQSEEAHHVHEGEEDLSPEEQRVLERKMKKILKKEEKKKLKAEGKTVQKAEVSGPAAPQQALDYLTCWAENRTEWKFQKTRQTWLLQHMFDSDKIPDDKFSMLLEYLEGLRGGSRDTTVQKALTVVQESGQEPEDRTVQQRAQRAREVIQLLS